MSQSNNTIALQNMLLKIDTNQSTKELRNKELEENYHQNQLMGIKGHSEIELLMSEDEFLDLIPANSYFH